MSSPLLVIARWVGAAVATTLLPCATATAVVPPVADPAALPSDPAPSPSAMVQRADCVTAGITAGTTPVLASPSQAMLDLPAAWRFSRGEGQTVAVIDTGVQPGSRLPNVDAGGDYIGSTDGLVDCDGHGTLVAGIIAGQPSEGDGFAGVAPAARILSIRQTSARYDLRTGDGVDPSEARIALAVDTLSRAIVHAADLGVRVISVPVSFCVPGDKPIDQDALGAAIRYAVLEKDAVLIAAAGNTGTPGLGSACESNPLTDVGKPEDPRNWAGALSVSTPAWWQPYVLSVGSVTPDGRPSPFTMAGPWVGAAAPGEAIVSVSNSDGSTLANGLPNYDGQLVPIGGTGYAAAYVSGVAALVRSRFPELTASQVVERLSRTARNPARSPSNLLGAGIVDPVAALTFDLPSAPRKIAAVPRISLPPTAPGDDPVPARIAFAATGLLAVGVLLTAVVAVRRRTDDQT